MKKIFRMLTLMVLVLTVSTSTALASGKTEEYDGVSPIDPGQKISTDDLDPPSDVWNILNGVGVNTKVYLKFSSSKYLNFDGHIY